MKSTRIWVKFNTTRKTKNRVKKIDRKDVLEKMEERGSIGDKHKYNFKEMGKNVKHGADLEITWIDDNDLPGFEGYSVAMFDKINPGEIYLNINNWKKLRRPHHNRWIKYYGKRRGLEEYRRYVINHELGHVLGGGHEDFNPGEMRDCHLMEQQTYSPKRKCKPSSKIHKKTLKILKRLK